jgi:hypothetical protein
MTLEMRIKIKKGNHYPFPYYLGMPKWVNENKITTMAMEFMFMDSCIYDLKDEDQGDVNKLFGFSIGYHHKTSFRFGWRADLKTNTIEIVAYEYHDKVRQATMHICNIATRKSAYFLLCYYPDGKTEYAVYQDNTEYMKFEENIKPNVIDTTLTNIVNIKKKSGLGYTLGLYFGGNETAPQDIIIYRKKIKNVRY